MDLKAFLRGETPVVPGRGFGGLNSSVATEAAHRSSRRSGVRWRIRTCACVRPHRRRYGFQVRSARSEAWAACRCRGCTPGSALWIAQELAGEIAANGPLAVRTSKYLVTQSDEWTLTEWTLTEWTIDA